MAHFYFASVQSNLLLSMLSITRRRLMFRVHKTRRSIFICCRWNDTIFYLNPKELLWKTSISVGVLIAKETSCSCFLFAIYEWFEFTNLLSHLQYSFKMQWFIFPKKILQRKKFNRNVFIYILLILSNMPKYAISLIYSPFICTATTDPLYRHNSPLLLSRTRALELHFSGSLWLCVVVSLKRLSSRSPSC